MTPPITLVKPDHIAVADQPRQGSFGDRQAQPIAQAPWWCRHRPRRTIGFENTLLKFAAEPPCSGRRRLGVVKTTDSLCRNDSIVGPSSANWRLPPRSMVALSVAVSLSPSLMVADAVRLTRPLPRTAI